MAGVAYSAYHRRMEKTSSSRAATVGLLLISSPCLLLLGGCTDSPSGRGGYRSSRDVQVQAAMVFEDDYDYYPTYEVYYSRNRREYVYRNTHNQWVRSSEPSIVASDVLRASPSVPMDFHDSPERHHDSVVRSYPQTWQPEGVSEKSGQKPDRNQ